MSRLTEDDANKQLRAVACLATNAEKLSWRRKLVRMEKYINELKPFEEEILRIYEKKQGKMDQMEDLRKIMVAECIHSREYLVHKGTHIECKFCGRNLSPVIDD